MIDKLKDLWIIFKKVYNEHYALKHKAFDAIKEYKTKMTNVCKIHYHLSKVYSNLDEVLPLLPIKADQQHLKSTLQSTLYTLHYAAKADEDIKTKEGTLFLGYGLNDIYANLYRKMEYDFDEIKKLYKEKKYDDVIERVEKMLNYLDHFYLEWKIVEQK